MTPDTQKLSLFPSENQVKGGAAREKQMHRRQLLLILITGLLVVGAWSLRATAAVPRSTPPPEQPPPAAVSRGTAEDVRPETPVGTRPARVVAHYGFGEDGYRPYAAVEFETPAVGAALPGKVVSAERDAVSVKAPDGIVLSYARLSRVLVRPGQDVAEGDPVGLALGPVLVSAERGGRALDPVALLWPEMSRFSAEAGRVEEERRKLAEELRRRALLAALEQARAADQAGERARPTEQMGKLIRAAAEEASLDPALVAAVAAVESGFNPRAVSPAGAVGVMQLMPGTAAELGVSDPFDPAQNVRAGARYLRNLLDRFGKLELALAAYNAGPGAVERYGGIPPYRETVEYVKKVLDRLRR